MAGMRSAWVRAEAGRVAWAAGRAYRRAAHRLGLPGLISGLAAVLLLTTTLWVWGSQHDRWMRANRSAASPTAAPQARPVIVEPDARARLRAFDDLLLEHGDIPTALQELIALAEANGLVLARGSYRPQPELQGGYLRYRMVLPVTGDADAVQRFMTAALGMQRPLSLESVQFKRARSDTAVIEARINWALLTRLPPAVSPSSARAGEAP